MKWLTTLVWLVVLCLPHASLSQSEEEGLLNKLLAPGPLMDGHKDFEHADSGKGIPNAKCLDCHKDIRKQVEQKRSFHGLMLNTCISCHRDHQGRDYDSVAVDEKKFDHEKTGYSIKGPHEKKLKCADCHNTKREKTALRPGDTRYFVKSASCSSCHSKESKHFFKGDWGKQDCGLCHGVKTWKQDIRFVHGKDTGYPLEGKHQDLKCAKCHVPDETQRTARYKWSGLKQQQCLACHQDVHKQNLSGKFQGGACSKCHTQEKWQVEKFDHSVTSYSLHGKHAEIDCLKCHTQDAKADRKKPETMRWKGLSSRCLTCHKDYHQFADVKTKKLGSLANCQSCHSDVDWKHTFKFEHNVDTRYVVDGKHLELKCNSCHVSAAKPPVVKYHWPQLEEKTCENCHKSPHVGIFSPKMLQKKCTECHITAGWKIDQKRKDFPHEQTRFPLTGKHQTLACDQCHVANKKQVFTFSSFNQQFCIDCHKNPHLGQFDQDFSARSCANCHSTERFDKLKDFDHDQTRFRLRDAHAKLVCTDCHTETGKRFDTKSANPQHQFQLPQAIQKSCVGCHADYHVGQLGSKCSECHNEKTWKLPDFDHTNHSRFPLRDKHRDVKCADCHKPVREKTVTFAKANKPVITYKPLPTRCADCHKDVHQGTLGQNCEGCHTERSWKVTNDFHRDFRLHGTHYTLSCTECHKEDRKLAGLSEQCVVCHQKDDVHSGSLPNCSACHRQQIWEHTSFKHSLSQFPLRGIHRTLNCADCHRNGIYRGTPSQCVDCHRTDAAGVGNPPHIMPNFTDCKMCHNQFAF